MRVSHLTDRPTAPQTAPGLQMQLEVIQQATERRDEAAKRLEQLREEIIKLQSTDMPVRG